MRHRLAPAGAALLVSLLLAAASAAHAQGGAPTVEYTVEVRPEAGLIHVTTRVANLRQPRLELSLPVWTPGWYTVENYGKNILRLTATDGRGRRLQHERTRKQTWGLDTRGLEEVRVEFDYRADTLALNQAEVRSDFAFFTGTQLFLLPEGHRSRPSTIRFKLPAGWNIVTALKETSDPAVFTAADYDTLVDSPTEVGRFDVTRFEVAGKPHYFVATPAGAFSQEKTQKFTGMLAKAFAAQSAMFGGLPFDKYVAFYFFLPPESNAGGAVEHSNSYVAFAPPGGQATPEMLIGTAAHEFYHLWNVKRIRPAEMWPYDYSRENETPLLWVSEGFTTYFTNVALLRAGIRTPKQFLDSVASAVANNEGSEARAYVSPAEASVSTWLGYDTPVAFGISYYTQGQNLGALLDLSIRHDTEARAGLDDVMRALYRDHYLKGRGFTTADLVAVISRIAGRDYSDFFRRHVSGVEVPPYDAILGHAGYALEKKPRKAPVVGISDAKLAQGGLEVTKFEPNSPFAAAGLQPGDVLLKVDGKDLFPWPFGGMAGKTVKVTYRRGGEEREASVTIGEREETHYELAEVARPTPAQLRVRAAWMRAGR
jgi:predicted metalloprotease with PDZ domain